MKNLINKSIHILREVKAQFKNPAVLWSTGKDSTTSLALIKMAFYGNIPFPVIHLDTGFKHPKIYEFRDRIANLWNLDLMIGKNTDALNGGMSPEISKFKCCNALKTEALKQLLRQHKFDALIMSIRRDEHEIRNIERYFSPRDKEFKWHIVRPKTEDEMKVGDTPFVSEQNVELWDLYQTDFGSNCSHVRVHPILHWTELDVWNFIRKENLPINPLYFKGYRSLGCEPCTKPTAKVVNNIDDFIKNLELSNKKERDGRSQDKEDTLRKLRAMGYM